MDSYIDRDRDKQTDKYIKVKERRQACSGRKSIKGKGDETLPHYSHNSLTWKNLDYSREREKNEIALYYKHCPIKKG